MQEPLIQSTTESASERGVAFAMGELQAFEATIDGTTEGQLVADLFRSHPELPGVVLTLENGGHIGISQQEFLRQVAKPFGIEVYYRRPIRLMAEQAGSALIRVDASTLIEEAVGVGLRRPAQQLYEPFLVEGDDHPVRLVDFQTMLLELGKIAALRSSQMRTILESVPSGLMLLNAGFEVQAGYSASVERMLGVSELTGQIFSDLIGRVAGAADMKRAGEYLGVLFNPKLIDRLIGGINPLAKLTIQSPSRARHLAFRFQRIRTGGKISQILVIIDDLTRQIELERERQEAQMKAERRLQVLTQLAGADGAHLPTFLADYRLFLHDAARCIAGTGSGADDLPKLRRRCHALKGEAGTLGLGAFRTELHEFETLLSDTARVASASVDLVLAPLRNLSSWAEDLLQLGRRFAGKEAREELTEIASDLRVLNTLDLEVGHIDSTAKDPIKLPADPPPPKGGLAATLTTVAAQTARACGKNVHLDFQGEFEGFTGEAVPLLREVLQQLVRNAVIHGIEPPDERLAAQKNARGVIIVARKPHDEFDEFIVQDDGRGLDVGGILRAAGREGTETDAFELIFAPGISTAETVTEDAGRGIGLDQVRAAIVEHGGSIEIHHEPGRFCAFQILLPRMVPAYETADC